MYSTFPLDASGFFAIIGEALIDVLCNRDFMLNVSASAFPA
jgi:hypothetical protein